jgi:hypothetical protein
MVYDDAWDMPRVNWVQQGSFAIPEIPPAYEPDDEPLVCLPPINQYWLPYVMGALDQLRNPSSWLVADDDAMYTTLGRVTRLRQMLGDRAECFMFSLQFTEYCVLQYSTDGGATWTDVSGWDTNFPVCNPPQTELDFTSGCELQQSFDGGETFTAVPGWDTNFGLCVQEKGPIIGLPPNPGDQTPGQLACSIADYLASTVILEGIQAAVTTIEGDLSLLSMADSLLTIIPEFVLVAAFVDGVSIVYTAVQEGTLSDYEAALSDPSLWTLVRCAIFNAIEADGMVTPGNFAAIASNISGITYTYSDVITAIHAFVEGLGATGLAQLSQLAGLNTGADCTSCGDYCARWNFDIGPSGFGATVGDALGSWVAASCEGVGTGSWFGGPTGPYTGLDISTSQLFADFVTEIEIIGTAGGPNPYGTELRSVYNPVNGDFYPFDMATGAFDVIVPIGAPFSSGFRLILFANPGGICVNQIIVRTSGSAPGGNGLVAC